MRCFICNSGLNPEEIHYDKRYEGEKYGPYVPCGTCMNEIHEVFDDHLTEEELDRLFEDSDELETGIEEILE